MPDSPGAYHQHCVGISVATRVTGTRVPAVLQPFLRTPATLVTGLRRLERARGGLNIHRTSCCRFVPEHAEKLCRSSVQNRFIESCFGHCAIGEILARYGIRLWLRTSDTEAHFANPLQPEMPVPHLLAGLQPPAIAMGFVSPDLKALERLKTGIAWRLPRFDATEEGLESQVETLQRQLGRLCIETAYGVILSTQRGEIFFLYGPWEQMALPSPGCLPLLQRRVTQLLMSALDLKHGRLLLGGGIQAIGDFTVDRFHNFYHNLVMEQKQT